MSVEYVTVHRQSRLHGTGQREPRTSRHTANTRKGPVPRCILVAILLPAYLLPAGVNGQEGSAKSTAMAEKLAALRTEINDLDASLRSRRNLAATELRGLQTRASELELAGDAERIKVQALQAEAAALEASITGSDERSESLRGAVREAIAGLRKVVKRGLPFKQDQRLGALTQIGRDLDSGKADAASAAARVWRFVQDERRLASTVELADVSLVLRGDTAPTLVRAVRVGMVAMFVYAGSDRWGRVVRGPDGAFHYTDIQDRGHRSEIQRLFQAVEKQIREGRYRLPLFGNEVGR